MKEEFGYGKQETKERQLEIQKVIEQYRLDGFFDLGLKPTGLDSYPLSDIVDKISKIFKKIKPNTVILPYNGDVHSDHKIAFDFSYSCTKAFRHPYVKRVLMMEVTSETNFSADAGGFAANYFVDISDYLEKKIKIMNIYKNQMKKHPFPRSIETVKALATIRGAQAGCKYAEGFMLVKEIC